MQTGVFFPKIINPFVCFSTPKTWSDDFPSQEDRKNWTEEKSGVSILSGVFGYKEIVLSVFVLSKTVPAEKGTFFSKLSTKKLLVLFTLTIKLASLISK